MKITIEKLVHGGSGLGTADGKKIFVPYAAPGDLLEVEISADHGEWAEAGISSIIEPSPCRVNPPCPVFGKCGGCQWQHISYPAQLEWKRAILIEAFERIGKIQNPDVPETLPSPREWNYRNRIQLHVDSKGRIGFYKPRSKEVVEFSECMIADEKINAELKQKRTELSSRDRGISLKAEGSASFAQVNSLQNENLKSKVVAWMKELPHRTVVELYAGSGNFTFDIARIVETVIASDIDGRAIREARARQAELEVENIEFICAPAARALGRMRHDVDLLLVDPPRGGCEDSIGAITKLKPQAIFYISCNPATLARDARTLFAEGYSLARSLPIDMFPQTFHVESLSLFQVHRNPLK